MALTGIEIFKMLPKTNCKECGFPTCLAFAMGLASGKAELDKCPYVSDEAKEKLAAASAPPKTACGPSAKTYGCGSVLKGVVSVGNAEISTVPSEPGLPFAAGMAALMIESTVAPATGRPKPVTVAPSRPAVTGKPVIWLALTLTNPGSVQEGNASVMLVPARAPIVVPSGTFAPLIAFPTASAPAEATVAVSEPAVVVSAELYEA